MVWVEGLWVLNEVIEVPTAPWDGLPLTSGYKGYDFFTVSKTIYYNDIKLIIYQGQKHPTLQYLIRNSDTWVEVFNSRNVAWTNQNYRYIDFGDSGKGISDEFYDWLRKNARMPLYAIKGETMMDIADAIRAKLGSTSWYKPSQMNEAILSIGGEGIIPAGSLELTYNGSYNVATLANIDVNIPIDTPVVTESLEVTSNGTYIPSEGVDGFDEVVVNVPTNPVINSITINSNGTYIAPSGIDGYSPIVVDVPTGGGGSSELGDLAVQLMTDRNSITSVTIPDSATKIDKYAFYQCESLTDVTLPDSITEIGASAFYGCKSLESINLPNNITQISSSTFYNCENLALTSLPEGITNIGEHAFNYCLALKLTSLPESVTEIGAYAFRSCKGIETMRIPSNVQSIISFAFQECSGLTTVTFEGTPTTILRNAFNGCTNLITINVPWAEGAVSGAPWGATNATINYNYTE